MTNTTSTLYWVERYLNEGWSPIPIPTGEKGPRIEGWEKMTFDLSDFAEGDNIGVHLGRHDKGPGLYDADIDDPAAVIAVDMLMKPTGRVSGRRSKPRTHRFYTCDEPIDHFKIHGLGGANDTIIELRGISPTSRSCTQTVVPLSTHPSGESVEWACDQSVEHFTAGATLIAQVKHVGIARLIARVWPGKGHRHDPRLALAGFLYRALNDEQIVKAIGRAVMKMTGSSEQDWLDTARTTIAKLKRIPTRPLPAAPRWPK